MELQGIQLAFDILFYLIKRRNVQTCKRNLKTVILLLRDGLIELMFEHSKDHNIIDPFAWAHGKGGGGGGGEEREKGTVFNVRWS